MNLNKLFDINYIKRNTPKDKLKVTLKKVKGKGVGLYAAKSIKEDGLIAYYKVTVFREKGYKSPTNMAYSIAIMTRSDKPSKTFLGDITLESLPPPCKGIPYWGYFSNEPTDPQEKNCYIDTNLKENYRGRSKLKEGDTFIYKLRAERDIKAGEEITWCYGDDYERTYNPNC